MKDLEAVLREIEEQLDEKDAVREVALKTARALARLSVSALRALHRHEAVDDILAEARDEASKLKALLADHPDLYHSGFVEGAQQELAEVFLTQALIAGKPLPTPAQLGVTNTAYLLGLGDTVGELRRFTLERLRRGDIDGAQALLEQMEFIHDSLMRFDHPAALVGVRRKQDVARALVEKTRGEVVVAAREQELAKKIDGLKGKL